jgi:hypothetical protein
VTRVSSSVSSTSTGAVFLGARAMMISLIGVCGGGCV